MFPKIILKLLQNFPPIQAQEGGKYGQYNWASLNCNRGTVGGRTIFIARNFPNHLLHHLLTYSTLTKLAFLHHEPVTQGRWTLNEELLGFLLTCSTLKALVCKPSTQESEQRERLAKNSRLVFTAGSRPTQAPSETKPQRTNIFLKVYK